jgi:hypothetical protein
MKCNRLLRVIITDIFAHTSDVALSRIGKCLHRTNDHNKPHFGIKLLPPSILGSLPSMRHVKVPRSQYIVDANVEVIFRLVCTSLFGSFRKLLIGTQVTARSRRHFWSWLACGMWMLRFTERMKQLGFIFTDLPFWSKFIRIIQHSDTVAGQHGTSLPVAHETNGRGKVLIKATDMYRHEVHVRVNDNVVVIIQVNNVVPNSAIVTTKVGVVERELSNGQWQITVRMLHAVDPKVVPGKLHDIMSDANRNGLNVGKDIWNVVLEFKQAAVGFLRGANVNVQTQPIVKALVFEQHQVAFTVIAVLRRVPEFHVWITTAATILTAAFGHLDLPQALLAHQVAARRTGLAGEHGTLDPAATRDSFFIRPTMTIAVVEQKLRRSARLFVFVVIREKRKLVSFFFIVRCCCLLKHFGATTNIVFFSLSTLDYQHLRAQSDSGRSDGRHCSF